MMLIPSFEWVVKGALRYQLVVVCRAALNMHIGSKDYLPMCGIIIPLIMHLSQVTLGQNDPSHNTNNILLSQNV